MIIQVKRKHDNNSCPPLCILMLCSWKFSGCPRVTLTAAALYISVDPDVVLVPVLRSRRAQGHHRHRRLPLHERLSAPVADSHTVHCAADGKLRHANRQPLEQDHLRRHRSAHLPNTLNVVKCTCTCTCTWVHVHVRVEDTYRYIILAVFCCRWRVVCLVGECFSPRWTRWWARNFCPFCLHLSTCHLFRSWFYPDIALCAL